MKWGDYTTAIQTIIWHKGKVWSIILLFQTDVEGTICQYPRSYICSVAFAVNIRQCVFHSCINLSLAQGAMLVLPSNPSFLSFVFALANFHQNGFTTYLVKSVELLNLSTPRWKELCGWGLSFYHLIICNVASPLLLTDWNNLKS